MRLIYMKMQIYTHIKYYNLETVLCYTGLLCLLIFVIGCRSLSAAGVQILHEPKEGQFIEESL